MDDKEKRHQVEDREWLSEDIRMKIPKKSDDRCVWCGKKVFFSYGGTVDHFIPLKKGGTNDFVNLVLMCKDCNEKKKSYVTPVSLCGKYLVEPYYKELEDHVDNYLQEFNYVSRGNLMAFDMYELYLIPEVLYERMSRFKKGKKAQKAIEYKQSPYLLKRAYPEDIDSVYSYFIKYLKKYDSLDSEQSALENIKFWMRFGAVYYIEAKGEIQVMSSMVVNKHGYISINLFTYYSTPLATTLTRGVVKCLAENISKEHNLPYTPVSLNILANDTTSYRVHEDSLSAEFNGFRCSLYKLHDFDFRGSAEEGEKNLTGFLSNFTDIEDQIKDYFRINKLAKLTWMADEILERAPEGKIS